MEKHEYIAFIEAIKKNQRDLELEKKRVMNKKCLRFTCVPNPLKQSYIRFKPKKNSVEEFNCVYLRNVKE